MPILTNINNIPLYTTVAEALRWGKENGLEGYHTHKYKNRIGYMGGKNHKQVISPISQQEPQPAPQPTPRTTPRTTPPTTSSSSGGGGY